MTSDGGGVVNLPTLKGQRERKADRLGVEDLFLFFRSCFKQYWFMSRLQLKV